MTSDLAWPPYCDGLRLDAGFSWGDQGNDSEDGMTLLDVAGTLSSGRADLAALFPLPATAAADTQAPVMLSAPSNLICVAFYS